DYLRRDKDGNLRPLQLERAAEVVDITPVLPSECKANGCAVFAEFTMAEMFSCRYFKAFRLDVRTRADLADDARTFQHLLCVRSDYLRRDKDGNLRPLQLERAAEVVDLTPVLPSECKANGCAVFAEFTMAEMFSCRYFKAFRLDVRTRADLAGDARTFQHLLCV